MLFMELYTFIIYVSLYILACHQKNIAPERKNILNLILWLFSDKKEVLGRKIIQFITTRGQSLMLILGAALIVILERNDQRLRLNEQIDERDKGEYQGLEGNPIELRG